MRNNITLNLGRSKKKSNNIGGLKVFVCVCLIIVTNLLHIIETLKNIYIIKLGWWHTKNVIKKLNSLLMP